MRILGFTILLMIFTCSHRAMGQVVINELMASNTGVVVDPDYDESSDWIELFNAGSQSVNLKGFALTDDKDEPTKWIIQSDVLVQAGGYLLVWADGMGLALHAAFKLSADGEYLAIYSPDQQLIDSVSFGPQDPNISYGRTPDGGVQWGFFTSPTPGKANTGNAFTHVLKSVPHYSVEGGIYTQAISLNLKSLFGGEVRYTLDGSEPEKHDALALHPISINQTTVVRARIFKEGMVPGPVVTHTYFIDPARQIGELPVIAISTAPGNFWDPDSGIYVQDFKPDWEIPVNIELFENDGSDRAAFNLGAGVKVNGLYSWQLPQKMLGVYFRKAYGAGKLEYPLIYEKQRKQFDSFALRASGSDWAYTLFRDGLVQNATYLNTHLDNSGFRACVVYVNGQYMGIHNIREKIDEDFVVQNHQQEKGSIDVVENENYAEAGSLDQYNELLELIARDLSIQENFDAVAGEINLDNFTDLIVTELYDGNTSIDHNVMCWKPKEGGQWNWIIMDLDRGFFSVDKQMLDFYVKQRSWPLKDLFQNEAYRKYLGRRLADHLFTTYHPDRMIQLIDQHQKTIDAEVPKHIQRWAGTSSSYGNPISSYSTWQANVEKLRTYAGARPGILLNDLTNYGFNEAVELSVSILPENAGQVLLNGLELPLNKATGAYPGGENIQLIASARPGYVLKGWRQSERINLVPAESSWKYSDEGIDLGTAWRRIDYSDTAWRSAQAELGYGDDDENTIISYGTESANKYITTYFRKTFHIDDKSLISELLAALKCDDGAIVYLNGQEVFRFNMPEGVVNYQTSANEAIGGSDEDAFHAFAVPTALLVNGLNLLAVEIHQVSGSSSDLSFDLMLSGNSLENDQFLTTNDALDLLVTEPVNLAAVFEPDGRCMLPALVDDSLVLRKDCSPYVVPETVNITSSGSLYIEAGVEIYMADDASILANGPVRFEGTATEPIIIRSDPSASRQQWGNISIRHVTDTSVFRHVMVENAGHGFHPVIEAAAIALFHTNVLMDGLVIENVHGNPIAARYSDVTLINSQLRSFITGDLINVKYGKGYIANCRFTGNDQPDTDAIDYDDVENSVIRNCSISGFYGPNSDGIDIGEKALDVLIDSVFVSHVSDKGISVGQQSSVKISNSVFTNCNMGIALKDSCEAYIDYCTFYGNNMAVASYEKNRGDAGGNGFVAYSILSNSYEQSYWCDEFSSIKISNSLSDNDPLPDGANNLLADPLFKNPTFFDFALQSASPGTGHIKNLGAGLSSHQLIPDPMITEIAYLTQAEIDVPEFIAIYNPAAVSIDLSGYRLSKGVTYAFPEGTKLPPGQKFYVSGNSLAEFWEGRVTHLKNWTSGRLADEGESIILENAGRIPIDGVKYNNKAPWPLPDDATLGLRLKSVNVDNHFGANWEKVSIDQMVSVQVFSDEAAAFYPNPFIDRIFITWEGNKETKAEMLDLTGKLVLSFDLQQGINQIQTEALPAGLYLLKAGKISQRILKIP